MGKERIICHCKGVSYIDIRRAMVAGARTIDEIKNLTGAGTECGGCIDDIMEILASVCGRCKVLIDNIIETGR